MLERLRASGPAWVAEADGAVVGLLALKPHPDYLLLENVAVDPASQGAGVVRRLLDLADQQARSRRLPEIRLHTHETMTENEATCARRGYTETHRSEEHGFQRVFMMKRLDGVAPP